jgi:hypothetical protein
MKYAKDLRCLVKATTTNRAFARGNIEEIMVSEVTGDGSYAKISLLTTATNKSPPEDLWVSEDDFELISTLPPVHEEKRELITTLLNTLPGIIGTNLQLQMLKDRIDTLEIKLSLLEKSKKKPFLFW